MYLYTQRTRILLLLSLKLLFWQEMSIASELCSYPINKQVIIFTIITTNDKKVKVGSKYIFPGPEKSYIKALLNNSKPTITCVLIPGKEPKCTASEEGKVFGKVFLSNQETWGSTESHYWGISSKPEEPFHRTLVLPNYHIDPEYRILWYINSEGEKIFLEANSQLTCLSPYNKLTQRVEKLCRKISGFPISRISFKYLRNNALITKHCAIHKENSWIKTSNLYSGDGFNVSRPRRYWLWSNRPYLKADEAFNSLQVSDENRYSYAVKTEYKVLVGKGSPLNKSN